MLTDTSVLSLQEKLISDGVQLSFEETKVLGKFLIGIVTNLKIDIKNEERTYETKSK